MDEIPRRSFLTLLGGIVAAAAIPAAALAAAPLLIVEVVPKIVPPTEYVRRWIVTGITMSSKGESKVRLGEVFVASQDDFSKQVTIGFDDISSLTIEPPPPQVFHTWTGEIIMTDPYLPATAEITVPLSLALDIKASCFRNSVMIEFAEPSRDDAHFKFPSDQLRLRRA